MKRLILAVLMLVSVSALADHYCTCKYYSNNWRGEGEYRLWWIQTSDDGKIVNESRLETFYSDEGFKAAFGKSAKKKCKEALKAHPSCGGKG